MKLFWYETNWKQCHSSDGNHSKKQLGQSDKFHLATFKNALLMTEILKCAGLFALNKQYWESKVGVWPRVNFYKSKCKFVDYFRLITRRQALMFLEPPLPCSHLSMTSLTCPRLHLMPNPGHFLADTDNVVKHQRVLGSLKLTGDEQALQMCCTAPPVDMLWNHWEHVLLPAEGMISGLS